MVIQTWMRAEGMVRSSQIVVWIKQICKTYARVYGIIMTMMIIAIIIIMCVCVSHSVVSDSLPFHGL